jgi:hypothetical protein
MDPRQEFDGLPRRVLTSSSWGLALMMIDRPYLTPVPDRDAKVAGVLRTLDRALYDPMLGLKLYSLPIANDPAARRLVGRMGIIPSGCSENGEYHHGQVMAHFFRLGVAGQADKVWEQFKPMMSASRDESLCGPFETPACSYAVDRDDPHFAKGMYFGLSGSVDWIVEFLQRMAGVELNLFDPGKPDLVLRPNLPGGFTRGLTFKRMLFKSTGAGRYREIPLTVRIVRSSKAGVTINGKTAAAAEVADLSGFARLEIVVAIPPAAGR